MPVERRSDAWSGLRGALSAAPLGSTRRAYPEVDGARPPDDVQVQLVHGHVNDVDELWGVEVAPLELVEPDDDGRHQFAGSQPLRRTGSFGYSVRIVPKHPALANAAELGLARNA